MQDGTAQNGGDEGGVRFDAPGWSGRGAEGCEPFGRTRAEDRPARGTKGAADGSGRGASLTHLGKTNAVAPPRPHWSGRGGAAFVFPRCESSGSADAGGGKMLRYSFVRDSASSRLRKVDTTHQTSHILEGESESGSERE